MSEPTPPDGTTPTDQPDSPATLGEVIELNMSDALKTAKDNIERDKQINAGRMPKPVRDTCSDCKYFMSNPHDLTQGFCFGDIPVLIAVGQGRGGPQAVFGRPTVALLNIACRHYKPKR